MFVVTLPRSAAKNPLPFAKKAKAAGADVLEIRGDLTRDVKKFSSPLPLLASPRGAGIKFIERLQPTFVDLEKTELKLIAALPKTAKLILSFHDHEGTPSIEQLRKITDKFLEYDPFALKIVTTIKTYKDLVMLEESRKELQSRSRLSMFAMGEKAHLTRLLSPMRDAFTYSFLDGTEPAAAGQLSLKFYSMLPHVRTPQIFGIIGGSQISPSFSPLLHMSLYEKYKVDALFTVFPTDDFKGAISDLEPLKISGLAVTAPFKREAFELAEGGDALAQHLQSVNTLVRSGKGWSGSNTDVVGIERGYPFLVKARSVAILGAGGAVPSVLAVLRTLNPNTEIIVFARDSKKAASTLNTFDVTIRSIDDFDSSSHDAIICAVSEDIDFPLSKAKKGAVALDLRYGAITKFMKAAKRSGCRVYDGLPMLVHQGVRQFELFTGIAPSETDIESLLFALQSSLSSHGR